MPHLPIWPAAASQDLFTAININTDKHKAKYQAMLCKLYVIKNDWVLASPHSKDQRAWNAYESTSLPVEPLSYFPLHLIHVSNACKHQRLLPGLSENMESCYMERMCLQDVYLNVRCNL